MSDTFWRNLSFGRINWEPSSFADSESKQMTERRWAPPSQSCLRLYIQVMRLFFFHSFRVGCSGQVTGLAIWQAGFDSRGICQSTKSVGSCPPLVSGNAEEISATVKMLTPATPLRLLHVMRLHSIARLFLYLIIDGFGT